ncbi:hypothetical protein Tco_0988443 [Tanacetum coccineum]|uniref:Uncharacterized protein n=1 Tax=Tanacetum coccineum TaxID=301880 RepID=A0ABQ5EQY7_9ASTR
MSMIYGQWRWSITLSTLIMKYGRFHGMEMQRDMGERSKNDPLDSSCTRLVTPSTTKKVNASRVRNKWIDKSPNTLEASQNSLQVSTVGTKESTSSQDKGQREGKALMLSEETPKKSKEKILQEEASLAEAIRLDSYKKRNRREGP